MSSRMVLDEYGSCVTVCTSDHCPIFATYTLYLTKAAAEPVLPISVTAKDTFDKIALFQVRIWSTALHFTIASSGGVLENSHLHVCAQVALRRDGTIAAMRDIKDGPAFYEAVKQVMLPTFVRHQQWPHKHPYRYYSAT